MFPEEISISIIVGICLVAFCCVCFFCFISCFSLTYVQQLRDRAGTDTTNYELLPGTSDGSEHAFVLGVDEDEDEVVGT